MSALYCHELVEVDSMCNPNSTSHNENSVDDAHCNEPCAACKHCTLSYFAQGEGQAAHSPVQTSLVVVAPVLLIVAYGLFS